MDVDASHFVSEKEEDLTLEEEKANCFELLSGGGERVTLQDLVFVYCYLNHLRMPDPGSSGMPNIGLP